MKGLVCAGGEATRLGELTRVTNKHLLPVGSWPMVYYPLQLLQLAGIREVLVVTGKGHAGQMIDLLGDGHLTTRAGEPAARARPHLQGADRARRDRGGRRHGRGLRGRRAARRRARGQHLRVLPRRRDRCAHGASDDRAARSCSSRTSPTPRTSASSSTTTRARSSTSPRRRASSTSATTPRPRTMPSSGSTATRRMCSR